MSAPDHGDIAAILAIVDTYMQAVEKGDADALAAIFHASAQMYGRVGSRMVAVPIARFFEHVRGTATDWNASGDHHWSVAGISLIGDIATVTVDEFAYEGRDFRDVFTMIREDGEWCIATKAFARIKPR